MFYTHLLKFFFFSSLFPVKSIIFVALIISIVNAEAQNIRVANSNGRGMCTFAHGYILLKDNHKGKLLQNRRSALTLKSYIIFSRH